MLGPLLTNWTIRLALICYAAVLAGEIAAPQVARRSWLARLVWTIGCVLFLGHVACAFQFYHHWSHAEAYVNTAERTGEMIGLEGTVFLRGTGLAVDVGTFIFAEHRGRGFGCEAKLLAQCFLFESFPLERVDAYTLASHARARRGLELCGMRYEGRRRRCYFSQGRYVDLVYYVIFREQWERLPVREYVRRG